MEDKEKKEFRKFLITVLEDFDQNMDVEVFEAAEKYYKENKYKVPMVILKEGSHFREPKIIFN